MTASPVSPVMSQRDVVFTEFMLRMRATLAGEETAVPLRLQVSAARPVARATMEWFELRTRAEQVIAEANSMSPAGPVVDLDDEAGTGQLAFVIRSVAADHSYRISLGRAARTGWVELERSYQPTGAAMEPEDRGVLEDLIVELVARPRRTTSG
jgi:hypothetical protein